MKTIKPIFKATGIIFLMYFYLMLVTAIGLRMETSAPISETEPVQSIEDWMLDPGYLDDEAEPAASIEDWMLDPKYLDQEVELLTPTPEWMLNMQFK
jgi:hypothetical protein